ncbi:hypothetical protein HN807_03030, partial [Candidatus Bathyarchaeota archaeon]|nr:hypothetical protein [Candidatus Bathyarchaeota archaeon]
ISKTDLLSEAELEEMMRWSEDPYALEESIDAKLTGMNRSMSQEMMEIIGRIGMDFDPLPVSSANNEGFADLYSKLMLTFTDGGKFTP